MKLFLLVLCVFLISGCATSSSNIEANEHYQYYYIKKEKYSHNIGISYMLYLRAKDMISKTHYRILPYYMQNLYEKVYGDECNEVHCQEY